MGVTATVLDMYGDVVASSPQALSLFTKLNTQVHGNSFVGTNESVNNEGSKRTTRPSPFHKEAGRGESTLQKSAQIYKMKPQSEKIGHVVGKIFPGL